MLDGLKRFRDSFSEKSKMLIYVSTAIIVLVISCLLPLAFRDGNITDGVFDTGDRAAMFAKYVNNDKSIRYKADDKPEKAELKYCESIFDELASYCILDSNSRKTVTEGYQFINLSDNENNMRLCRMWLQDKGDWTNWMEVYIDVDTGFVYYLYISSVCLDNADKYYSAIESELNAKSLASLIAKETGYDLKIVNWSGKAEDTATAYTAMDGDALIWNIYCSYYASSMLDVKISVA